MSDGASRDCPRLQVVLSANVLQRHFEFQRQWDANRAIWLEINPCREPVACWEIGLPQLVSLSLGTESVSVKHSLHVVRFSSERVSFKIIHP